MGQGRDRTRDPWICSQTRFPTMWYVRPGNAQTSLRIRTVISESLLVA